MKISRRQLLTTAATGTAALALGTSGVRAAADIKVAMALPGSIADGGWSQSAYDALETAKAKLGIETAFSEKVAQPDHVEVLSDYARRGFTHVIGHGGEFQDGVDRVAERFPDTMFVVTNGFRLAKNVASADFYFSQPAYIMGFIAGKMTKSGKVGIIQAQQFKFTNDTLAGFDAGFKSVRADGEIFSTWTGDWEDVAKGKEAALNQLSQGADIVWPTMDSATVGSLQAVKEKGAMSFGLYYDAITKWPDIMLQSDILDVRGLLANLFAIAKEKGLEGKNYRYDFNTPEAVRIGTFHSSIPADVVAEAEALVEKMKSGDLKPPV